MKESEAPELSIGASKVRTKEGATVQNEKKNSEIGGGLLFFLVYWTVCWFIGLLFRVLEKRKKKKKKKRKEKQRRNGTVNCIVLICLVSKIITAVSYTHLRAPRDA